MFPSQQNYPFRSASTNKINIILLRKKSFKKPFSPYCINEWNKLNVEVTNAKSIHFFKKKTVTEKKENFLFSVYEPFGVNFITPLRLQLNHLSKHKFGHGLGYTISPMCGCNAEFEDT